MPTEVSLMEMLDARERRVQRQRVLLEQYHRPLICFTMNICGPVKDSPLIRRGFARGQQLLWQQFFRAGLSPLHQESCCSSRRVHTVAQLQEKTTAILTDTLTALDAAAAAQQAVRAILYEVATTPKPGLVDRCNSGSHTDMNFFTFMDSAASLYPYFEACARAGQASADRPAPETKPPLPRSTPCFSRKGSAGTAIWTIPAPCSMKTIRSSAPAAASATPCGALLSAVTIRARAC